MSSRTKKIITLLLRWFLGLVFVYAAVGKITDPAGFAGQIDNYRILPWILVGIIAAILPWVELLCGLLLLTGQWLRGAALWVMAMNLVFIIAIASAMIRGLSIECGCFALQAQAGQVGLARILEDVVFLLTAAVIYRQTDGTDSAGLPVELL
jgi:putative oxidoreductase